MSGLLSLTESVPARPMTQVVVRWGGCLLRDASGGWERESLSSILSRHGRLVTITEQVAYSEHASFGRRPVR
jgi:hypothetical protein